MLEVKHLEKSYGKKKILEDVSFQVKSNEITALIGLNGSGKSTIMRAIMQLTPYEKGEILLNGEAFEKDDFHKVMFIPDEIAVQKSMTIKESLAFMETFYPNYNHQRAVEIAKFFRLNLNDQIASLSKGNVSKVNLLLGLCTDSEFVIMDEPFSGIDVFTREEIANVFVSDLLEGRGVLVSTHEIEDIEFILDKAVLLDGGHVVKEFYPEEERAKTGRSIKDIMREVYLP